MPSTYTNNLGIQKPGTGEQSGTWGDTVNVNSDILDVGINGVLSLTLTGTSSTLTTSDGVVSNGQYKALVLTGSPSGTHTITISPNDAQKIYYVYNTTAQSVVFTQGSGGNVTILTGDSSIIYANGAGTTAAVVSLADHLAMSSVRITGGSVTGITDLAVADGGTGASDAATARSNLGLAIGTNVQAYDAGLQSIAGLTTAADRMIYTTALDVYAVTTLTSYARTLLDDADALTARATLGVTIGTNVQAYDATLQSISALGTAADKIAYTTGIDTWAETTLSAYGRTLIDDADAATARTTLGLGTLATQSGTFSGTFSGTSSGTNTGDQNIFQTVAVAGQSSVVADSTADTLTLAAGSGVSITTNALTDTITISATGTGGTLTSVDVSGGTTGLTTSGGPITTSGTITLGGTLGVANGGTGATTLTGIVKGTGTTAFTAAVAGTDYLAPAAIGSTVQAYDAGLQSISALVTSADKTIYTTASDTYAVTGLTAFGRSLIDDADAATGRATLGLTIGTDVQAYDADLAALAALATTGILSRTGAGTAAARSISAGTGITVTNGDGVSGNPTVAATLASQAQAEAGTDNTTLMTPLRSAQAIAALAGLSGLNIQSFTVSGTYTPTAGYRFALVFVTGGGGGGSGSSNSSGGSISGGSSGGAGATTIGVLSLSGLAPQAVTIGAGGAAAGSSTTPTAGGASSIGTLITADGSGVGTGGSTGTGGVVIPGSRGLGSYQPSGGGGGGLGAGGSSFWGGGATSASVSAVVFGSGGACAAIPTSPGSGTNTTSSTSAGKSGIVIIVEFK